jgi:hypothetical protein
MVTLTRSAAIPLAVVVFGFVTLTEPSNFVRSALMILAVSLTGLTLLAATTWWQASVEVRNSARLGAQDAKAAARIDSFKA